MRYYIAPEAWSADEMIVSGEEAHHLLHVLRGKAGDQVLLMDGQGREATTEILESSRKEARLRVIQQRATPPPAIELTLIQSIPREQKMDFIVQKSTELGIRHIYPVVSEHGVVRLKPGEDAGKRDRWRKIALSAAKQSGGLWIPEIHPVQTLIEGLGALPRFDVWMTCSLEPDALPLRDVIRSAQANRPRSIGFLVGPEGDLTVRERAAARNGGARMVSLGSHVLRSETAALYVLSVLQYEFCA